jgi:hypothetical protein
MSPLSGDNLRDVLFIRASSAYNSPAWTRIQASLGQSVWNYINAYGAGGEFYNPVERTGQYIFVWSPSFHCTGIGGMNQAAFESIKPEITAMGWPPLS